MGVFIYNREAMETPDSEPHRYELLINNKTICFFHHVRADGLEDCLRAAADAVNQSERVAAYLARFEPTDGSDEA